MRKVLLVLILAFVALSGLAAATHFPDHRFHVRGNVVDSFGMPGMFVRVDVVDVSDRSIFSSGSTGFGGDYDVILHLHNSNVGDQVQVTVAGQSTVIVAEFDPTPCPSPPQPCPERFSPRVPFTIPPGANLVPYILIAVVIVVPLFVVLRRYAPARRLRPRAKLGLDAISGIGKGRVKELKTLGIDNVEKLAGAEAAVIADNTSFSLKEAKRVVRRAGSLVEERRPPT